MTPQQLRIRLNRAAKYLVAGNPALKISAADLHEAAQMAKLPSLDLQEHAISAQGKRKVDDPLAVAMTMRAVALIEERRTKKPTAALLERRKAVMDAAFARVSAIAA